MDRIRRAPSRPHIRGAGELENPIESLVLS
jgi:hypothetical protein